MDALAAAVVAGADPSTLTATPTPRHYYAAHTRREDVGTVDPDVRHTIHLDQIPLPELGPDEALVAVMASGINFNTVWSATFQPVPTFRFLERYARTGGAAGQHDQPYHVLGSDAAGVVVRTGAGVRRWLAGDRVVVHCTHVDDQEPVTHGDGMLGSEQRIWGYETNFGGLAHYTVVRASQLLPKPAHLSWEEAACIPLCAGTAYRMLVGEHGARIKQGDIVLIWGATGGLGGFATQLVRGSGGIPVGVIGSSAKAELALRLGCAAVVNRHELGLSAAADSAEAAIAAGKRLGRAVRGAVGEDPHVVFDYLGRETFGMSVVAARRGGTIVTCGSSTGFVHSYDNRYLWMNLKRILGSHSANYQEAAECNRLVQRGLLRPILGAVFGLDRVGEAARLVQTNGHVGKVGVLCLAPEEGLGITDLALRVELGEPAFDPMRRRGERGVGPQATSARLDDESAPPRPTVGYP